MQQADYIRTHLVSIFHPGCKELLAHELVERLVIKRVDTWQQVRVHDAVRVIKQVLIDFPPVCAACGKSEVAASVGLGFPLDQYCLPDLSVLKHDDRVGAGEVCPRLPVLTRSAGNFHPITQNVESIFNRIMVCCGKYAISIS